MAWPGQRSAAAPPGAPDERTSRGKACTHRDTIKVAAANGIGTPAVIRAHIEGFQAAGVDQVIFLQQAGRNRHDHIRRSLELFAAKVMPEFKKDAAEREAKKAADLAPYIEAAMKRKRWMAPLEDHEIPVAPASRPKAQINEAVREGA